MNPFILNFFSTKINFQADLDKEVSSTNSIYNSYDYLVFECLLCLISLVSDRKYHHFQPVLDLYIKESFSATLAYRYIFIFNI